MNRALLHFLMASVAAALGWHGAGVWRDNPPASSRSVAGERVLQTATPRPAWENQLAAARSAPPARASAVLVQWTFAIQDADVPAAIARLDPYSEIAALRCLYARWARLDPASAWQSFSRSAIPRVVHPLCLLHDDGVFRATTKNNSMYRLPRDEIAAAMIASMQSADMAFAKALAARLRDPDSEEARAVPVRGGNRLWPELQRLSGKPGEVPPATQAADANALPEGPERAGAVRAAAHHWIREDSAAAFAWLRSLPAADLTGFDLTSTSFHQTLSSAAPQDGATAGAALLLSAGVDGADIARAIGAPRLAGNGSSIRAVSAAAFAWAKQDSAAATAWLGELPEGDLKATLAGSVAGAMAQRDVNAAISLLNTTGGDQDLAISTFMHGWVETDARAALHWSERIEDAALRDTTRITAALEIAENDPGLAIETAQTLENPAMRRRVYDQVRSVLSWNPAALAALQLKFPAEEWTLQQR